MHIVYNSKNVNKISFEVVHYFIPTTRTHPHTYTLKTLKVAQLQFVFLDV